MSRLYERYKPKKGAEPAKPEPPAADTAPELPLGDAPLRAPEPRPTRIRELSEAAAAQATYVRELEARLAELRHQLQAARQREARAQAQVQHGETAIVQLSNDLDRREAQLAEFHAAVDRSQHDRAQDRQAQEALRLERDRIREELTAWQDRQRDAVAERETAVNSLSEVQRERDELRDHRKRLQRELTTRERQIQGLENKLAQESERHAALQAGWTAATKESSARVAELEKALAAAVKRHTALAEKLDAKTQDARTLQRDARQQQRTLQKQLKAAQAKATKSAEKASALAAERRELKKTAADQAAEAAERERELTHRLEMADLNNSSATALIEAANRELDKLAGRCAELEEGLRRATAEAAERESRLQEANAAVATQADKLRTSLNQEVFNHGKTKAQHKKEQEELRGRIRLLEQNLAAEREKRETSERLNAAAAAAAAAAQAEHADALQALQTGTARELEALRAKVAEADALRAGLAGTTTQRDALLEKSAALERRIAEIEAESETRHAADTARIAALSEKLRESARKAGQDAQAEVRNLVKEAETRRKKAEAKVEELEKIIAEGPSRRDESGAAEWHLRLEDGREFGPSTLADLKAWAAECRIGPHHEVSRDRAVWIAAKHVPALHMDWTVPLIEGGFYGPLSMFAVQHLIQEGVVAPDAVMENRLTGEKRNAALVLNPEVLGMKADNMRLESELRRKNDLLAAQISRTRELQLRLRELSRSGESARPPAPTLMPPQRIRQQIATRPPALRRRDVTDSTRATAGPA